jgi:hypothetical protein
MTKTNNCSTIQGNPSSMLTSHIRMSRDSFLAQALVKTRFKETRVAGGKGRSRRSNKPPSYQHKLLHASKFDGIVRIPSSFYPAFGQYLLQNPTYHPVPRVHRKEGPRRPLISSGRHVDLSPFFPEAKGGSIIDDTEDQTSTFIPYYTGPSEYLAATTICWNAWLLQLLHG